jgi:hypothetical protein
MIEDRRMTRVVLGLIALTPLLAGCASARAALPDWAPSILKPTSRVVPAPAAQPSSAPVAPPPAVVHTLTLVSPQGARGGLTLTMIQAKADATATTVTEYTGSGSISLSDDLGQWSFSYASVALHDSSPKVQALGVRFAGASGEAVAIDWNESALVDPSGHRHRLNHRDDGGEAVVWVADLGFESLPSGLAVTLALTLHRGEQRLARTFVFESRPPREEAPRAAFRPIAKWAGERFVVLPRPPSRPRDPYAAIEIADKIRRHPTPEEMGGVVLTVTGVTYDGLASVVTFVREDTKQTYTGRAPDDVVPDLVPLADIEGARKEWQGKTLWLATPDLEALGDESADVRVLPVKRLARVDVVDVRPGWSSNAPIRFMLRTAEGLLGFRDVHTTGTNVPKAERGRHAFEHAFLTRDPRAEFDWPDEVWEAIESARVAVGMTTAQARLSWGEPPRVERIVSGAGREERWMYADHRALVLINDRVTEVLP